MTWDFTVSSNMSASRAVLKLVDECSAAYCGCASCVKQKYTFGTRGRRRDKMCCCRFGCGGSSVVTSASVTSADGSWRHVHISNVRYCNIHTLHWHRSHNVSMIYMLQIHNTQCNRKAKGFNTVSMTSNQCSDVNQTAQQCGHMCWKWLVACMM